MSTSKDTRSAMKVLDALDYIAGFAVTGVSNATLSKQLGLPPSSTTRAMQMLIDKGWARKDETTGHFHPTPRMGRVFGRVLADLDRAEQVIAEVRHNFTRTY